MRDPDLRASLSALRPPSPDPAAQARAWHHAALALKNVADRAPTRTRSVEPPGWHSLLFLGAGSLAIVLLLAFYVRAPESPWRATVVSARRLLTELEQVFPGQLNAVIDRDGRLELAMAETPTGRRQVDQGLLVELVRGPHRLRILAYSGQPLRLQLDGADLRFEPLLTAEGGVLLAGQDFVWSSSRPAPLAGWQVEARALAPAL